MSRDTFEQPDINLLTAHRALSELDDYFHRMGGAGRYTGYNDADAVVYVGWQLVVELQEQGALEARQRPEPNERLEEAAATVLPRVRETLSEIEVSEAEEAADLVVGYVEFASSKFEDVYDWHADWLAFKAFAYQEAYYAVGPERPRFLV